MKSIGLDCKELTKKREVLTVRLRKQKRYTNLLTKRLNSRTDDEIEIHDSECTVIPDTVGEVRNNSNTHPANQRGLTPQQLDFIQNYKAVLVTAAPYNLRLEAITYFRKLVASDKLPPIEAIIHQGLLELLLPFFLNNNEPDIQFEIAWIVTNVACDFSYSLVNFNTSGGYVPVLMNILLTTTCEKVRDQVYWAVANMSSESDICRDLFLANNLSGSMSWLLNIGSYNGCVRTAPPSLATLKYSALICYNLVKDNTSIDSGLVNLVVNVLAILVQSPDHQDYLHIVCFAIQGLCEVSTYGIQLVFEKGLPKTLREFYDSKKLKDNARDSIVKDSIVNALATFIITCNNRLYLRVLLSDKFNNYLAIFVKELSGFNVPNSGSAILDGTAISIIKALNTLSSVDSRYTIRLIKEGIILSLMAAIYHKDDYELRRYSGEYLSNVIMSLTPNDIKLLTTTPDIVQIYDLLVSYDTYDDTVLFSILNALSFMMIHAENKNIFQSLHSKLDVYFNHNDIRISTIANNMHDILHS